MTGHPARWTLEQMPDLTGRRALVTGATSGLGLCTVVELARQSAQVLMTGRDKGRLEEAVEAVLRAVPHADVQPLLLDLADLSSVRDAAAEASTYGPLHLLVNNAGVMATPHRRTADGFELQLGTNHLGHFALTGLLLPQLAAADDARVVTVSSLMHRLARTVTLTDPRVSRGRYQKWIAYGQSKLANLLFAFELDRRNRAAGLGVASMAAHPGYAATNLQHAGLAQSRLRVEEAVVAAFTRLVAQPADQGALPTLMAATMPGLPGGSYVGPTGPGEARGAPGLVGCSRPARDPELARALWHVSEAATGVTYP
ncbi:MAG TPA: oxidoreductase [Nocardioidaceae bacterium]|jgi:NAD(P)-dependent dehydrogenase (short-subunit alcohol dehydrogenase family)